MNPASIDCFDGSCTDPADVIARDEKAGCLVAFCPDHREGWLSKDHIEEVLD